MHNQYCGKAKNKSTHDLDLPDEHVFGVAYLPVEHLAPLDRLLRDKLFDEALFAGRDRVVPDLVVVALQDCNAVGATVINAVRCSSQLSLAKP
jgi:hypothetical protein